jgi:ribonuclease G
MKKILVTSRPWGLRVAIIEDKNLQNIYFDLKHNQNTEKSFIKGKIIKILSGIQTAFINIGQDKAGFLHISEIDRASAGAKKKDLGEFDAEAEEISQQEMTLSPYQQKQVSIKNILKENETLLVQVSKEPINQKGSKLTTCFTLPGRFLILMPNISKIGISKKITDLDERTRLKEILQHYLPEGMGCIIRTTSQDRENYEILADLKYLLSLWEDITKKYEKAEVAECIHQDIDLVYQIIRDNVNDSVETIICDDKTLVQNIHTFIKSIAPESKQKIILYNNENKTLFEEYDIEKQIQKALQSKVELSSGGSIILENTEAMTVIDVNTGKFTGHKNTSLEETILKVNMEAAKEIVRQLKLRNIGGIIVIDFIDMANKNNRNKLFSFLERTLQEEDKSQSVVLKISEFGLVQMTRKRTGKTLRNQLMTTCYCCSGLGMIKSNHEITHEILRVLEKEAKKNNMTRKYFICFLSLNENIAHILLNEEFNSILYYEKLYNIKIIINKFEDASKNIYAYNFKWVDKKEIA